MQGIENDPWVGLGSDKKIESGEQSAEHGAGRACGGVVHDRAGIGGQANVLALEEELNAVLEHIVERDLGNGGVNGHLQLRAIELLQRALDDAIVFLVGVN